jgi:hypothetical protein
MEFIQFLAYGTPRSRDSTELSSAQDATIQWYIGPVTTKNVEKYQDATIGSVTTKDVEKKISRCYITSYNLLRRIGREIYLEIFTFDICLQRGGGETTIIS